MISTVTTRLILAVACLAGASLAQPALAKTTSAVHGISKDTFVDNCNGMGGEVIDNGGAHAGCDLPSGTSVVCSFEPADSNIQGGVCEVESPRVARTDLRHLLDIGNMSTDGGVPESLTSNGGGSGASAVASPAGPSGKGSYAGGAGGSPSTLGDGGPAIK